MEVKEAWTLKVKLVIETIKKHKCQGKVLTYAWIEPGFEFRTNFKIKVENTKIRYEGRVLK